jgi:hypothetical protein
MAGANLAAEQKVAEKARNTNATAGTATVAGGSTATQAPAPPPAPAPIPSPAPAPEAVPAPHVDPASFDWHWLLYAGIGLAAVLAVIFAYRAFVQHQRATALAAVQ